VKVQIPKELVGDRSNMHDAFVRCGSEQGDSKEYTTELLRLLPQDLMQAPVWFDKFTRLWRYEYGIPFDRMPEGSIVSGTNVHLPVCELYASMRIADKRLNREQLLGFLERLSIKDKHYEVLVEMRPIKDIRETLKVYYEILGKGVGNTTCDWHIKGSLINIVFDVKNRTKSLVDHMEEIIPDLNRGAASVIPSAPNPEDLFKSVENKLKKMCYLLQIQGAWIHSDIKEHEDSLTLYFNKTLNHKKVHFAILSDWKNDAYILARNWFIKLILKKVFHLVESKRFVTREFA